MTCDEDPPCTTLRNEARGGLAVFDRIQEEAKESGITKDELKAQLVEQAARCDEAEQALSECLEAHGFTGVPDDRHRERLELISSL
jgi:hypothetical protein